MADVGQLEWKHQLPNVVPWISSMHRDDVVEFRMVLTTKVHAWNATRAYCCLSKISVNPRKPQFNIVCESNGSQHTYDTYIPLAFGSVRLLLPPTAHLFCERSHTHSTGTLQQAAFRTTEVLIMAQAVRTIGGYDERTTYWKSQWTERRMTWTAPIMKSVNRSLLRIWPSELQLFYIIYNIYIYIYIYIIIYTYIFCSHIFINTLTFIDK